jgi:hypothetical protein
MLESLAQPDSLAAARLASSLRRFTRAAATARSGLACAARSFRDRALLELSRRSTGRLFASVDGVAKHFGYRSVSPKEMNLETMRLFTRFGLRIDSSDI